MKPVEALEKTLKWFAVRATRFTLITKNDKEEYVKTDVENDNAVARIQTYEYNHTNDNNIVAKNWKSWRTWDSSRSSQKRSRS